MNWFDYWMLERIFAKAVIQGPLHPYRIEWIFRMLSMACADEFTEDNKATRDAYLMERLIASQLHPQDNRRTE